MTTHGRLARLERELNVTRGPTTWCPTCQGSGGIEPDEVFTARLYHRMDVVTARINDAPEPELVLPDPLPAPTPCRACRATGRVGEAHADEVQAAAEQTGHDLVRRMLQIASRLSPTG